MCQCQCQCAHASENQRSLTRLELIALTYFLSFALGGLLVFSSLGYLDISLRPFRSLTSEPAAAASEADGRESQRERLKAAVTEGDAAALNELMSMFSDGERIAPRLFSSDQLKRLVQKALEKPGTEENKDLLYLAGKVAIAGDAVPYSSKIAAQLLSRAWEGGKVEAARDLTHRLKIAGELDSAYLWALRCVQPCKTMFPVSEYRKSLSGSQATRVEALAKDRGVVMVPSL